jgi:hypothetical protein
MESAKDHRAFETAVRIVSSVSIVATLVAVLIVNFVKRSGPEPNLHEILLVFMFFAQAGILFLTVITAAILAGFRGGVRLSRTTACLAVIATGAFVAEFFVMQ